LIDSPAITLVRATSPPFFPFPPSRPRIHPTLAPKRDIRYRFPQIRLATSFGNCRSFPKLSSSQSLTISNPFCEPSLLAAASYLSSCCVIYEPSLPAGFVSQDLKVFCFSTDRTQERFELCFPLLTSVVQCYEVPVHRLKLFLVCSAL